MNFSFSQMLPLLFLALALSACPPKPPPAPEAGLTPECETRADCAQGQLCSAEQQCEGCRSSGECSLKETCDPETLLCQLRENWGTECASNDACAAGAWCKQGLCVDRSMVSLCPNGENSDCPKGERCNVVNTVCEEDLGCTQDADCSAGEVCNTGNYSCVPRCTIDTQAELCAAGEKCVAEKCVQCAVDSDCAAGLSCDKSGKCALGNRCYQDRDCPVPLACYVPTGACLPKRPPCISDDNCGINQRCVVGTGKCVFRDCQPDVYEPNNERNQAFGVTAGSYTDLTLCLSDIDYFAFTLARGDQLGVNVDADLFSENTFTTAIQDASGRTLAFGKLLTSYVATAPATYYVSISTTDPYQPYDITFLRSRGIPCDDDGFEPNDSEAQATQVNSATQVEGAICPQDTDYFSTTVPSGKGIRASLINYNASNGLLRLCVLDGLTVLGCSDDAQPVVNVANAWSGTRNLRMRVLGSTERTANTYTLKVEFP